MRVFEWILFQRHISWLNRVHLKLLTRKSSIAQVWYTSQHHCLHFRQKQINHRKRVARENEAYRELAYSEYNKQVSDNTTTNSDRQTRYRDSSYPRPKKNEYASIRDWPLPPPPIESSTYEKNQNGGYFRSSYPINSIPTEDYLASTGSGSENIYQMPEVSDGSGEECPRYFELDPGVAVVPGPGKGHITCPGYMTNTGTGVHGTESMESRYSNWLWISGNIGQWRQFHAE